MHSTIAATCSIRSVRCQAPIYDSDNARHGTFYSVSFMHTTDYASV